MTSRVEDLKAWQFFIIHGACGPCNWWEFRDHTGGPYTRTWTNRLVEVPQLSTWYRIEIATIKNSISLYINGELKDQRIDNFHPSGGVCLFAYDAIVEFDNVVITGDEIPDMGPSGFAVEPGAKSATTWGRLKR